MPQLFPAFQSKNYRYYFLGQLVSQIGTWLQIVAQGWLVLTLTDSPVLIGAVAASLTLPSLLFSLFGGVIVDRFDKQKLIIFTNTGSMILAGLLGILTLIGVIEIWHIIVLSFLLGTINAIDMPARQAFVSEMVEKDKLASAIALNASIYNSARVIGPSVAGILIGVIGVGGAFLFNAITYIAAIAVQFVIVPMLHPRPTPKHPLEEIRQGIVYTAGHPIIRSLIMLTAVVSIFGWSYTTILPLIAKNVYGQDATGLGYLFAAAGAGAVSATFFVSAYASRFKSSYFINGGIIIFAVAMIGFSYASDILIAYIALFFSGFGLLSAFSVINARIQHLVEPHVRGRVMSIYLLMFVGLFPVGNLQIGFLSELVGAQEAIRIGAVVVLIASIVGFLLKGRIIESHKEYVTKTELSRATNDVSTSIRRS